MSADSKNPLQILVVDDEMGICILLQEALKLHGAEVKMAANRHNAEVLLNKHKFDIAFVDLTLPDSRGYSIIRRAKEANPSMMGIIMSGTSVESFKDLTENLIDDYISKPFSLDQIAYIIARYNRQNPEGAPRVSARTGLLMEVGHQLKGPLAVIKEFSLLLKEGTGGELTVKQATYIQAIEDNVGRALHQVRLLENHQQTETGESDLDPESLGVSDLLAQVVENWHPVLERRGLRLTNQVENGTGAVLADYGATMQILFNLMDNACKYAPEGSAVSLRGYRSKNKTICIELTDEGSGIPADQREAIFLPFGRLPDHQSSPGLGLGLTIALRLARRMQGDLLLEEAPTGGARFILQLPPAD